MSQGYLSERIEKISQIMPSFAQVAQPGDKVLLGLEGDPCFPQEFNTNRPECTITSIQQRKDDHLLNLSLPDGTTKEVSSLTLAADQVWEFTDATFANVLEREKNINRAESSFQPLYRGTNNEISDLRSQIQELKTMIEEDRNNTKHFHNTMVASVNEVAADVCKLDSSDSCEFCKTLTTEYNSLMSRAEGNIEYRGVDSDSEESTDDDDDDDEEEEESSDNEEEDLAADETDYF